MSNKRFRIGRGRRLWLFLLPLLSLTLAIWACSAVSVGPRRAIPPPVTHLPASQLRMEIQVGWQYEHTPDVQVSIRFFEADSAQEVSLPEKARLTCNGSDVKPNFRGPRPCLRQPPGGAYRFTYTDEHSASTTVVVPVPAGSFAILSPTEGSTVKIPTDGQLTIRYAIPIAPPKSSISLVYVVARCHGSNCASIAYLAPSSATGGTPTPGTGSTPTAIEYHYPPTPTLDRSIPTPTMFEQHGPPTPTPAPGYTPPAATGGPVTQSNGMGTIALYGGFAEYQPGSGEITLTISANIAPDTGAFAVATASMGGSVTANITWVR